MVFSLIFFVISIFIVKMMTTMNSNPAIPMKGILKVYRSARSPITADEGLARRIRFDR